MWKEASQSFWSGKVLPACKIIQEELGVKKGQEVIDSDSLWSLINFRERANSEMTEK